MAPTPSSTRNPSIQVRTPHSKHRLNFTSARATTHPSPNPNSTNRENPPQEHPIEVVGRIRNFPACKEKPTSVLQINPDKQTVRVRADVGYRDFTLDGVSLSEEEDIDAFYKKFVESRVSGVRLGNKCTIMMYGPTGSGKSHTMFGCAKQPGIVYRSLKDILGDDSEDSEDGGETVRVPTFVQVTVLEIYNEEIYDLLANNTGGGGFGIGWPKSSGSKVIVVGYPFIHSWLIYFYILSSPLMLLILWFVTLRFVFGAAFNFPLFHVLFIPILFWLQNWVFLVH